MATSRVSSDDSEDDDIRNDRNGSGEEITYSVGHITLLLKQGHLPQEQVDVIVNSTSGNLNLKSGAGSRALLNVGGESIQEECNKNYPSGIHEGEIAETKGGTLQCVYVFHCFLRAWNTSQVPKIRKIFCDCVSSCLQKASSYCLSSIAFPALGAGFLAFPVSEVVQLMVDCISDFSNTNKGSTLTEVRMVIYPGDANLFQDFSDELKSVLDQKAGKSQPQPTPARKKSPQECRQLKVRNITIAIKQGSIVDEQVDVLVNITNSDLNLTKGIMGKTFLDACGSELQEECYQSYEGGIEDGQIAVTKGYKLCCKAVYHTSLPVYSSDNSEGQVEMLYFLTQQCLMQAEESEFKSIAMPVFGTGHHNFPPKMAAHTILEAIGEYVTNNKGTSLREITLVVYTGGSFKNDWRPCWKALDSELQILQKKVSAPEDPSGDARKDSRVKQLLQYRQMMRRKYEEKKGKVAMATTPEAKPPTTPETKPPSRGTSEWYKFKYEEDVTTPPYWSHFKGGQIVKKLKMSLTLDARTRGNYVLKAVDKATYDAVTRLVYGTWEADKVGHGKDARGLDSLNYTKIKVTNVQRVENLDVYEDYAEDRKKKFCKAWKNKGAFKNLKDKSGSKGPVATASLLDKCLANELFSEINEHYLLHGTKEQTKEKILNQGLDSRMAGDNAMFGQGVYAAESSTKADQYADPKDHRSASPKMMFLVRMCLGEICLCKNPVKYRKSPCLRCLKDDCEHKHFSDSVVGDGTWIFREFVVYKPSQVYPEFLITYVRE